MDLAENLRRNGVDAILDKWDLRDGQDAAAYMESIISDKTINKVLLVCDPVYVTKANDRSGGAGTEAQIISAEIYKKSSHRKYLAVIAAKDQDQIRHVPAYYGSKIFVDMTLPEEYDEKLEQVLRWIFEKPLHQKPEIGQPPAFLNDQASLSVGASSISRRFIESAKHGKPSVFGLFRDFLSTFSSNLEKFRISSPAPLTSEQLQANIDSFQADRNLFGETVSAAALYIQSDTFGSDLHRFFERFLYYLFPDPLSQNDWGDCFDNFRFFAHELFLLTIAALIKHDRLEVAKSLLDSQFFVGRIANLQSLSATTYSVLLQDLENRHVWNNERARGMLLRNRANPSKELPYMIQADFVCFLRLELSGHDEAFGWHPHLLGYPDSSNPLEIFARARSRAYLSRVLALLGEKQESDIHQLLQKYASSQRRLPKVLNRRWYPELLIGIESLGKLP